RHDPGPHSRPLAAVRQPEEPVGQSLVRETDLRAVEHVGRRVLRPVVGEEDLGGRPALAKVVRATREARLDAASLVVGRQDQGQDGAKLARRSASTEAASTPTRTASRPTPVVAIAVPLALGALPGRVVATVLADRADREIHAAHAVDLGHLHLHLVADVHDVLDPVDPIGGKLAHANEAFLPGKVFDERADAHDPGDLAVVDLADLGLLRQALDHRSCLLAAFGLRPGDPDRAVVLELDRRPGLRLDRTDHLAAWPDDLADLVGLDLDRLDAWRPPRQLGPRLADDVAHRFEDEQSRVARLLERRAHDVERDPLDLDVHLERGHALRRAGDLEVHV